MTQQPQQLLRLKRIRRIKRNGQVHYNDSDNFCYIESCTVHTYMPVLDIWLQCCGFGLFIPVPDFSPSWIPDPESWIPCPTSDNSNKEKREEIVVLP
jgi:hypothetical protein